MQLLRILPLNRTLEAALKEKIDGKAKPPGALGRIEDLALHLGLVKQSLDPELGAAAVVVFAGDHGLVAEGIAAYPQEVSGLIARMILDGGAGANIAAGAVNADVFVVDTGLVAPLAPHPRLFSFAARQATRNAAVEPAMTQDAARIAFDAGVTVAETLLGKGYGVLALGEVGIGNSSAASAVAHLATGLPVADLAGPGAGLPPGGLAHKVAVIERVARRASGCGPFDAIREAGGFEMQAMAGAIVGAVQNRQIVLVDGFIATAVAVACVAQQPALRDYLIFTHLSPEKGHQTLLSWLNARPLIDLGMRLGEGTGAALAIPFIRMAEGLLRNMADLPGQHPQ